MNRAGARARAQCTYNHIMELALIQAFRVYHVVPDSILREIEKNRDRLQELYRRAYTLRSKGNLASVID